MDVCQAQKSGHCREVAVNAGLTVIYCFRFKKDLYALLSSRLKSWSPECLFQNLTRLGAVFCRSLAPLRRKKTKALDRAHQPRGT